MQKPILCLVLGALLPVTRHGLNRYLDRKYRCEEPTHQNKCDIPCWQKLSAKALKSLIFVIANCGIFPFAITTYSY